MSDIKVGFFGHDANLIHYVPGKWEKRWVLSVRWLKQIDKDWIYATIVGSVVLGATIYVAILDWNK